MNSNKKCHFSRSSPGRILGIHQSSIYWAKWTPFPNRWEIISTATPLHLSLKSVFAFLPITRDQLFQRASLTLQIICPVRRVPTLAPPTVTHISERNSLALQWPRPDFPFFPQFQHCYKHSTEPSQSKRLGHSKGSLYVTSCHSSTLFHTRPS